MAFIQAQYQKATPMIKWLIFIIGLCLFSTLILIIFQSKPNSLSLIKWFVINQFVIGDDSWKPMIAALEHIQKSPEQPAYDALFTEGTKFQYPLTSLLLFDLPHRITGFSYSQIAYFLDRLSSLSILVLGLISAKTLTLILKEKQFERLSAQKTSEKIYLYLLVLVLTALFYPIIRSYNLGQIQTLLTLLAALSILCWQCNKKILVGILIGFICLIKPQLFLLFIWGLLRRQWSMVISGGIVIGVFLLISIGLYGFGNNLYYLQILSFLSHHGESFYANQSVNGIMNRLLFNGENMEWDGKFPPYSPIIYGVTLVTSLVFILAGLLWRYKDRNPGVIDLCIIMLCTTMASPIAWEHHYGIVLTIFIAMSPFACYFYKYKKWHLFLLALGYMLVSQYYEFTKAFATSNLNILQSYLFFGACIILYFLFSISKKQAKDLT